MALSEIEEVTNESEVRSILQKSFERGRIAVWLQNNATKSLADYREIVILNYKQNHDYIATLQQQKSAEAWEQLFTKLQYWSHKQVLAQGYPLDQNSLDLAMSIAADAACEILKIQFPYDVELDAWMHVVVRNICMQHLTKLWRAESVFSISEQEYEQYESMDGNLAANIYYTFVKNEELRDVLLGALQSLPESKRQIIFLIYFEGWSLAEIAAKMNRNVNAIYKAHFDALKELRKRLGQVLYSLDD